MFGSEAIVKDDYRFLILKKRREGKNWVYFFVIHNKGTAEEREKVRTCFQEVMDYFDASLNRFVNDEAKAREVGNKVHAKMANKLGNLWKK